MYVGGIQGDADGRIRYHYTILDFCAVYDGGEARAGGDAADIAWADLVRLDDFGFGDEMRRIVALAAVKLAEAG